MTFSSPSPPHLSRSSTASFLSAGASRLIAFHGWALGPGSVEVATKRPGAKRARTLFSLLRPLAGCHSSISITSKFYNMTARRLFMGVMLSLDLTPRILYRSWSSRGELRWRMTVILRSIFNLRILPLSQGGVAGQNSSRRTQHTDLGRHSVFDLPTK